ncbi:hypothetical protein IX27_06055 [Streptomyces sp. JS01]|uniref:DUF3168 domain-containing protein n=1 Tax=Streptomyces rubiginosohelvolus TaxID=67362 RepID=A0ABW6F614_9ACTN|nr:MULTISPECIES: hypothetical protein [unclassified Streptomyces]KFK90573.1 hypothetical protein IX27_06055 [Streptomyces sp. JS01]MBK3530236.1 hypothetical protein [Streptomyces sp. MBT72]MBK3541417.1 hypothetical protein [Streptomyces sp. MBT67]MBK3544705.1 hypothetical protein [Streptomyces sp. MBT60]MBK3549073.1 hypothetical protein [Streptomyces sp. MBT61]
MPSSPSVFPDVQALVVDLLADRSELAGVIVDETPPAGFDGTARAVLVSRVGGAWIDDLHLDQPLVELEVYGPDKSTAHTLANTARAALLAATGTVHGTATVTDIAEADGPRWLPDFTRPRASRYLSTYRVSIRPA